MMWKEMEEEDERKENKAGQKNSLSYGCMRERRRERSARKKKNAKEENSSVIEEFSSFVCVHLHIRMRERRERIK